MALPCHPLRTGLKYATAVLGYLLTKASINSWTLHATKDFAPRLDDIFSHTDPSLFDIDYIPFDVKSMFTDLPKDAIRHAVMFFSRTVPPAGINYFYIHRYHPAKGVTFHVPSRWRHHLIRVHLQTLVDLIFFDLEHSVFLVGVHIFLQELGNPMGSYVSATLAICTCAHGEHTTYTSLHTNRLISPFIRVNGIRFMGDGILMIAVHKLLASSSRAIRQSLRDRILATIYPPLMTLELETFISNFPLLECLCIPYHGRLLIRHRNKNFAMLTATGYPRFQSARPFSSYTSRSTQRTPLIGDIYRAMRNTSYPPLMHHSCY